VLDLRRLRLLREVARRGTLAAAAEALSYSPSTVSQQLRVLEAEAGARLLEPVGRGVRLTAQGRVLVEHAEALLQGVERAEAAVAAVGPISDGGSPEVVGEVRVAAFQTAAHAVVPPVLSVLAAAHPRLRVAVRQVEPEQALPALRAGDLDLVVAEEYPGHPLARPVDLVHLELGSDALRLAVPEESRALLHGGGGSADLARCAGLTWVMEPEGTASRAWSTALCRAAGFEPVVGFTSDDLLLHARLVRSGHAAALLPDLVWAAAGEVVARPGTVMALPGDPRRRLFAAVRRGSSEHPAVRVVYEALRAQLADVAR